MSKHKSNFLANEKSPYLVQHASNPVRWYPWGDKAFKAARKQDKPIFLSIGYSACHWCHVMEKESFEDEQVAQLLNESYISIKVDREERPDIDKTYMAVAQILSDSSGWPLTVVMTPEGKPFFAATYIPKHDRYGRVGLLKLLPQISQIWESKRDEIEKSAGKITQALQKASKYENKASLDEYIFKDALQQLENWFDKQNGGFGIHPKFPQVSNLIFLLRYGTKHQYQPAIGMVTNTLDNMRNGGIWDHVGYGFHRYSTDQQWLTPHFEKMLYDQALLSIVYLDAFLVTGNQSYALTAKDIFSFVLSDLTSDKGGFFSSIDADSQGEEGIYYLWSYQQLEKALGAELASVAAAVFNIDCKDDKGEPGILHISQGKSQLAEKLKVYPQQLEDMITDIIRKLFSARKKRPHPCIDQKILTDWNGLMVAALAKGGRVLERPLYIEAAKKGADFILDHMLTEEGLYHCWHDGLSSAPSTIDDYSYLVWGLLELYQATFNLRYLKAAIQLNQKTLNLFLDSGQGGLYYTPSNTEAVIYRQKEASDVSLPSGNSVSLMNLVRLSKLTNNPKLTQLAEKILESFSYSIKQNPQYYTFMLYSYFLLHYETREVIICGQNHAPDSRELLGQLNRKYLPEVNLIFKPCSQDNAELDKLTGFTESYNCFQNQATAYVCSDFDCKFPTRNVDEMMTQILGK